MLFWVVAALLTFGACLAVLIPLGRPSGKLAPASAHDIEVYRDQLSELERDAARGVIGPAAAQEARNEISRRILRVAETGAESREATRAGRWIGFAAVLAVPLVSWGVYGLTGSPGLPGEPLQARLEKSPAENTVEELVARAEAQLAANPSDPRGWDVLAPIYLRIGRADDAVTAYENAIRLAGASAAREAGLGEALAAASGGIVTSEAQAAFERALKLQPQDPKSLFFLATAQAQEGNYAEAAGAWRKMLSDLPQDSPWRGAVERAVAQADAAAGGAPSQEAAAQDEMIREMVASLDERLRADPNNAEGWKRLVRSYVVLGRQEQARDALRRGVEALGAASDAGRALVVFAGPLGVSLEEQE